MNFFLLMLVGEPLDSTSVRIAQAVGSKMSTTTTPVHHPNTNSFVSTLHPCMLDPFPLVSLVEPLLNLT